MYKNTKSLHCAPGSYSVAGQLYFKNKLIEKEIRFVATRGGRGGGAGEGELNKGSQRYKLPVIRYISTRGVMYNMINTINSAVCYR